MKKSTLVLKRVLTLVMGIIMFMGLSAPTMAHANNEITVTVDGRPVNFAGQQPAIINGRTLVPVRGVFEMLGFDVYWESATSTAIMTNAYYEIRITIGSHMFTTNGAMHTLDVPAQSIGGRIVVPLRFPLESVGATVGWNRTTSTVSIFSGTNNYLDDTPGEADTGTNHPPPVDPATALNGRIIVLDAGHGHGNSPGFAGYVEHVAMLQLSHNIRPLLEARGATVILTRPTASDVPLPVRAATINLISLEVLRDARRQHNPGYDVQEIDRLMNIMEKIIGDYATYAPIYFNFPFDTYHTRSIHPDLQRIFELQTDPAVRDRFLVISLHSNATPRPINTSIHGADAYIMTSLMARDRNYFAYYANEARSRYFSNILLDNIHELGIARRGVWGGNWFMIREHNLPGALVENGFHTNDHDRELLSCNEFLQRLAVAYENAIVGYFVGMR